MYLVIESKSRLILSRWQRRQFQIQVSTSAPLNFRSTSFLREIRDEFKICQKDHEICAATSSNLKRPKRLIKLDVENDMCRIIMVEEEIQYAALSYYWGERPQKTLTTTTICKLQSGVRPSYFSKSIHDAMRVVAELGLEYLWVDAVCILQHDTEDMVEEITKMGDIYQGASFTIAASTALGSNEGFWDWDLRRKHTASSWRMRPGEEQGSCYVATPPYRWSILFIPEDGQCKKVEI